MKPVEILTIKEKITLYKNSDVANSIELIALEEVGFNVVAQKDLYNIGDKVVYIQPDYCLSDISLFESYIRPNGDESKSMLGKVNGLPRRIRAKKFNLSIEPNGIPVYSNGVLLPYNQVEYYAENKLYASFVDIENIDLTKLLEITKYEEPETNKHNLKGGSSISFPKGVIKTDEENFNNLVNHIEKYVLPKRLIGREKIDGSSITIWYKDGESGIASRNLGKPIYTTKVKGRRNKTLLEKIMFWKNPDLNIYEKVLNDSDFVKFGKPYLDILVQYCEKNRVNLVLQGELCGQGMKGSGNKNNPYSKKETDVVFFNICKYLDDTSVRLGEQEFNKLSVEMGLKTPMKFFDKTFYTIDELKQTCEHIFQNNKMEGIVIRDEFHNFSTKYMSLEYDSKK